MVYNPERVKDVKDEKFRKYGAMVCSMDDAVGKLLGTLKEHKLTESTLVFFFSDNGGPVGVTNCRNTPLWGRRAGCTRAGCGCRSW